MSRSEYGAVLAGVAGIYSLMRFDPFVGWASVCFIWCAALMARAEHAKEQ